MIKLATDVNDSLTKCQAGFFFFVCVCSITSGLRKQINAQMSLPLTPFLKESTSGQKKNMLGNRNPAGWGCTSGQNITYELN